MKSEEYRKQIALTDEQRENVRKMLTKFGGHIEEETEETTNKIQDDLFMGVTAGTTIEWHSLTPGTKKYSFVREVCCQLEPYVRSKIPISEEQFKRSCVLLGIEPHQVSSSLLSAAVEQADPITLLQIQISEADNGMIIERIRFIT